MAYVSCQLRPGVLRRLRKERGWSQVRLAEKAQLSEATVVRAEHHSRVGRNTVGLLCDALDVGWAALVAP